MKQLVLDKGYVEVISSTQDGDLLAVNAARCSFDKQKSALDDKDLKLIDFLAREGHTLPFRHIQVTFRMHLPIFVLRQLGKHQVGMSLSEVSRRYVSTEPEFYIPEVFRSKPEGGIKQGSGEDFLEEADKFAYGVYSSICEDAVEKYNVLIKLNVAPELARGVLPQSMYTTIVWTGSLLSWFHLWDQRTDSHAQKETSLYAWAIAEKILALYPNSWSSLCRHSCKYGKERRQNVPSWYKDLHKM